ncbi:hypothetical protein [Streptomyces sp. CoH27]|nr:hypothetical protein [Streptomyces sp. CoH27]
MGLQSVSQPREPPDLGIQHRDALRYDHRTNDPGTDPSAPKTRAPTRR